MLITKHVCLALCLGFGMSFGITAGARNNIIVVAADKSKRPVDEARPAEDDTKNEGLQKTLNLNSISAPNIERSCVKPWMTTHVRLTLVMSR